MSGGKISVVIPTLDSGWCLGETLQSIVGQVGSAARVIVVDSNSTDDTHTICGRFGVEVITEPKGNMYRAINAGLRLCDTEWLAYANADDPLYGDAHQRLIEAGEQQNADVVYGTCDCIDEQGRFLHSFEPPSPENLAPFFRCGQMPFFQQTTVFRRRVFDALSGFDPQFTLCADFDFFLKAYQCGMKFVRLHGRPLSRFRLHARQLSQLNAEKAESQKRLSAERAGWQATRMDKLAVSAMRLSNWPNYLERIVRGSLLRGRLTLPRSLDA